MRKLITAAMALLMAACCFTGCSSISTELADRGIVGAIGLDYENGRYKVTVLSFNTSLATSDQATFDVEYITGEGNSLHEAFEATKKATSKALFFGHNNVLVLGRALAEQKIFDTAMYLAQNKEARLNISVFMAEKTAEEIIRLKVSNKAYVSGALEKLADSAPGGFDIEVQLFQIMQQAPDGGIEGILPVVRAVELESETAADPEGEGLYDLAVDSLAVFEHSLLRLEAFGDIMTGIMLIENRVEILDLTVYTGQGDAYGLLTRPHTYISAEDARLAFYSSGSLTVRGRSNIKDDTDVPELKKLFEYECERIIVRAYQTVYLEQGIDLFHVEWVVAQETTAAAARKQLGPGRPAAHALCVFSITG